MGVLELFHVLRDGLVVDGRRGSLARGWWRICGGGLICLMRRWVCCHERL